MVRVRVRFREMVRLRDLKDTGDSNLPNPM